MIKTSDKLCKGCKYGINILVGEGRVGCYYIVMTGKDRGCPIGWCDKYEKRGKHAKNTDIDDYIDGIARQDSI